MRVPAIVPQRRSHDTYWFLKRFWQDRATLGDEKRARRLTGKAADPPIIGKRTSIVTPSAFVAFQHRWGWFARLRPGRMQTSCADALLNDGRGAALCAGEGVSWKSLSPRLNGLECLRCRRTAGPTDVTRTLLLRESQ